MSMQRHDNVERVVDSLMESHLHCIRVQMPNTDIIELNDIAVVIKRHINP